MSFLAVGGTLISGLAGGATLGAAAAGIGAGTIAAGAGLAGSALSLYGNSQQAKAQASTNRTNQASIDQANNREWNNCLLQRGVNTGGSAAYGTIPTNAPAVNTRLPLWANMNMPAAPAGAQSNVPLFVKKPTG